MIKQDKSEEIKKVSDTDDSEIIIICKHCNKSIEQSMLIGLSLICPSCGKPQNGHPKNPSEDPYNELIVICKHCGEAIDQAKLRGISLICPSCGKPQNGFHNIKESSDEAN